LKFLECLLHVLVNHVYYHLHEILSDYLQDFFFEYVFVVIIEFLGVIYLCFVGVQNWEFIFFISL
jgi:hypothetical protein